MGYVILWITRLAAAFLITAIETAQSSYRKKLSRQRFWPIVVTVFLFIVILFMIDFGSFSLFPNVGKTRWALSGFSWYGILGAMIYLLGAITILLRGLKSMGTDSTTAKFWPKSGLAIALLSVFFIHVLTIHFMVSTNMRRLSNIRHDTTSRIKYRANFANEK